MTTARTQHKNGWISIAKNPISKVGVFPYSGRMIGAPDPNKTYMVYRPEEELNNVNTVNSFKSTPLIDDHPKSLLGSEESGLPNVDGKPAQGVLGEQVVFENGTLYSNINLWTDYIQGAIGAGKKQLSAGFSCVYEKASGIYNGVAYDYIQRKIRGNHVALVDEGRMGPEVAVLDHFTYTFDAKELIDMADPVEVPKETPEAAGGEMTLAEITAILKEIGPQLSAINAAMAALSPKSEPAPAAAVDKDPSAPGVDQPGPAIVHPVHPAAPTAMDAAERTKLLDRIASLEARPALDAKDVQAAFAKRDELYKGVSAIVGAFEHSAMDAQDIAVYAAAKLPGLKAPKGHELLAVESYLAARPVGKQQFVALDASGNTAAPSAIRKSVTAAA